MIGAGVFTTAGLLIAGLGDPLLMLGLWLAGGIIALCGAMSYGELGAAMPGAGGEYLFLSRLFSPLAGFLSGWVSFLVGFSAPIAASAMGFSEYLFKAFPAMAGVESAIMPAAWTGKLISVGVILIFTFIHYRGIKTGSAVQNLLTVVKVAIMVLLIVAGFASGRGDGANFTQHVSSVSGFPGMKTIGLSLMWIMFAYSGWNAATYIGSELKNPLKTLPGSLLWGTFIVTILYVGVNALFVYGIHPEDMKGVIAVGGLATVRLFGQSAGSLFSVMIAFALFSSLSAFIIIGPRVYYSMAGDGLFFRAVARVHPRFHVPSNAILLQSLIAIVYVLSGTFDQILTYMGFSLGIFPLLAVAGVFRQRFKDREAPRLPGFPVTQIVYLGAGCMILVLSYLERPVESTIALLTVLAGIPAYYLFKRTSKTNQAA
ncbi:MAG: amino acid permease, partial [Bacteroidales bacterium]|nr:amino acid permease [Bacteroidales bacterium]